jgi:nucleoside-diphosphate-sugar epimerase
MSKVLITGGAGYIGDSAVEYLLGYGHDVTVFDSLIYGGAYMRQHKRLKFVRGDVRDYVLLDTLIAEHDSVLHLAAIVGDGACQVNPGLTVEVNEIATENIAELCAMYNKRMVFASTCSVYGANNDELTEDSPTNPLSVYAGTKLKAEGHVRKVPNHYIFRLGTLFGLSTPHARLRCDLVANILTYRAMSGQTLKVFGGEQWRPLLHVRDAGELMALASVRKQVKEYGEPGGGTYILSYRNYTMKELAEDILSICNLSRSQMEVTSMPFEDQRNYRVSSERRGNFWMPRFTLLDGIGEMAKTVSDGRIADLWSASHHNARYAQGHFNVS